MLEEWIARILPTVINILELMGILVVLWSASAAFVRFWGNAFFKKKHPIQAELAEGLSTALIFKMAAEILKTVLVRELSELVILGAVILLRALLSLLIHWEQKTRPAEKAPASTQEEASNACP